MSCITDKVFFTVLLLPAACPAQDLWGVITDASARRVPQAEVEVEQRETNARFIRLASETGEYHFLGLPPGEYRITVRKAGFKTYQRAGVRLRVADRISLEVQLELGDVVESVEVTGAAPLLQSNSGAVSYVVEARKVATLPLDGRNFIPLVALLPGVALPPNSAFPRINGGRPRVSEYLYDGLSVLQPEPGQVAFFPILDAIEEFRINTNSYSPEYGRANGGVIQVNLKSGTNEYHGTVFDFFRNEKLNARNLFAASGPKPLFRRNQYGFVFGGPLRKNKTFFFADYQGSQLRTGQVRISTVPTLAERQGVFAQGIADPAAANRDPFPDNRIPLNRFDPVAVRILERYPDPTSASAANNYRRAGTETQNQDQLDVRLDQYFNDRHRVFGRYTYLRDHTNPVTPLPDGSGLLSAGAIGNTLTRADSVVGWHTWNISAASLNQASFGYTRRGLLRTALRTGHPPAESIGIRNVPPNSFSDTLPVFQLDGYQQIGPTTSANSDFGTSVTQFLDTFSSLRGRHSLKMGADLRLERLNVLQPPNPSGLFHFSAPFTGNSLASLLLGQVESFSIDFQQETLEPRARIAEFFFLDDFRVTQRLSLNLGVRYTLNFPSTEKHNRGAVFDLASQRLQFLGKDGYPRTARELEKLDMGPRAGVAYRLRNSLVMRSGYGLVWFEQAGITTPFTTPQFPFIQTVGQASLDNISPAFVLGGGPSVQFTPPRPDSGLGQGVFSVDRNNGSGYAQQWNFVLQETFGENLSVEAGYLGSKLTRLGVPDTNLNQLPVEQLTLGTRLLERVANPFFGEIPVSSALGQPAIARGQLLRPFARFTTVSLYRNNVGHSVYHSLQARAEKRFSRGLTFTLAYTFSKLIDDASAVFDAAVLTGPVANYPVADSRNTKIERDLSQGDIPHVLSASYVYELPLGRGRRFPLRGWRELVAGGWQLAGIARFQSGTPVAVSQQPNFNSFAGFGTQRPNRAADPTLPADQRSTSRWFRTEAFLQAAQFTIGNSSRNPVRGPGYQTMDVMVGKTFLLPEGLRMEFRAEAFNVANTPPLANPNAAFGTPAFGSITGAGDPRVIELVVKLHF